MGLDALLARLSGKADTPDTPCNPPEVSEKPAWIGACTLDTPDTPEFINGEDVAAEPVIEMSGNSLTSFWADSDVDRNNQPESGGGQLPPMGKACPDCQHFARPGKSDGYCSGRDDLPLAYGENHPLRRLPADRGASCDQWQASE
jgi:hypothetical protein